MCFLSHLNPHLLFIQSLIHSITRPVNTYWAGMHYSSLKPVKVKVLVSKSSLALCDSMDCSLPGSSIHGILQQEYWSGVSFPSPEDLPVPGIKPRSPALQADSLPSEPEAGFTHFLASQAQASCLIFLAFSLLIYKVSYTFFIYQCENKITNGRLSTHYT